MCNSLRDSRKKKEEDAAKFVSDMRSAQDNCLAKEKMVWSQYEQDREEAKLNRFKDEAYL